MRNNSFVSVGSVLTYNATMQSGLLRQVINSPTSTAIPVNGDINLNVLLTDYTSYAFLSECQNVMSNTDFNENVFILVRSMVDVELTILPKLSSIFTLFFGFTDYPGGQMRYVHHDPVCGGL